MSSPALDSLILDSAEYARLRPAARAAILPVRARRRVVVSGEVVLTFENAATLHYQAQEMVYAERIDDPVAARHEADTYARLLPDAGSLCATMFIEITDPERVRSELERLRGIQHRFAIHVAGRSATAVEIPGPDEPGPNPDTHSVHFLRFEFDEATRDAFRDPAEVAEVHVDHPQCRAAVPLEGALREELIADLNR